MSSAIRPQVPVAEYLHGRRQQDVALADIVFGTGVLLNVLRQAFPRLKITGADLSHPYLQKARRRKSRVARDQLSNGQWRAVALCR